MNDFDRGARNAVKEDADGATRWLLTRMPGWLRWRRWLDSQSAPRPGEPDRRCDTIGELWNEEGTGPPWCLMIELFTAADPDAIERALEYLARFRRELRHGPHERDKYPFVVVLVFLTGASGATRLDMNLPGMEEVGLWFGPRIVDLSAEDGVAHLEAIEQNTLARSLLVWAPLMKGGQSEEFVARWRVQAELEPDEQRCFTLVDTAILFAQLTDSQDVWRKGLEGMVMKESNYLREARDEARIEVRREDTLEALKARFPGELPAGLVERVQRETDLAVLGRWHKLAITAPTLEAFQRECS